MSRQARTWLIAHLGATQIDERPLSPYASHIDNGMATRTYYNHLIKKAYYDPSHGLRLIKVSNVPASMDETFGDAGKLEQLIRAGFPGLTYEILAESYSDGRGGFVRSTDMEGTSLD